MHAHIHLAIGPGIPKLVDTNPNHSIFEFEDRDRKALVPTPAELPDELLDLLAATNSGEEVDANPTLSKQREIKQAAKTQKARIHVHCKYS